MAKRLIFVGCWRAILAVTVVFSVLLAVLSVSPKLWADDPIAFTATVNSAGMAANGQSALQFIQRLEMLENTYDPLLATLYSPQAVIELHRKSGKGAETTEVMRGEAYQARVRQAMDMARMAQEAQRYHSIKVDSVPSTSGSHHQSSNDLWITAQRQDLRRGVTHPIAWRLRPSSAAPSGWHIVQEIAEL